MNRISKLTLAPLCLLGLTFGWTAFGWLVPVQAEPPAAQPTNSGPIDWDKARWLHRRRESGDKLTVEEQSYLERAIQERNRQQADGQPGGAASQPTGTATIDWDKAKQLYQRSQAGEKLTPEEQAYLDRAKQARQQGGNRSGGGAASQPAPRETTGYPPLTDLSADGRYKEQDGGLYGLGRNTPPAVQLALALRTAKEVQPRNEQGQPAADGKIVLISVGMSNTTQEFSRFMALAKDDPVKAKPLVIVDGAQGGQDAAAWVRAVQDQDKGPFAELAKRIKMAGVSPAQVQVAWIKQALAGQARYGEFPEHAKVLQQDYATIITRLKEQYPNLRLVYLSSRIFAGLARTSLNPEPYAYEGAYSIRWLIQDQMAGKPELNADPDKGAVKAPVLLWGPYLWADGTAGRKDRRLTYSRDDLGPDGTHPSETGRQKVAELLLDFFKTDPTAKPWFLAPAVP